IYVSEGPDFSPRKLTEYTKDDGQEISSLTISPDGKWIVFVRGGDHGSREASVPVQAAFDPLGAKVQVISIPFDGGQPIVLSEGDYPVISPNSERVSFTKGGQIWSAAINGSAPAK
ncbi:MAG: S9 family peptidase, partial [Pedobacter sp.]